MWVFFGFFSSPFLDTESPVSGRSSCPFRIHSGYEMCSEDLFSFSRKRITKKSFSISIPFFWFNPYIVQIMHFQFSFSFKETHKLNNGTGHPSIRHGAKSSSKSPLMDWWRFCLALLKYLLAFQHCSQET